MKIVFKEWHTIAGWLRLGAIIGIVALFVFKLDLTKLIFKKTVEEMKGPVITETMTAAQYTEIAELMNRANMEKPEVAQPQIMETGKIVTAPITNTIPESTTAPETESPRTGSFYRYTDDNGVFVIVDDPEKVPSRYRAKMKVSEGSDMQRTAVVIRNNRVYVPVSIGYQGRTIKVQLLLDTGATGVTISQEIAQQLGIRPDNSRRSIITIADGTKIIGYNTTADFVNVGPKTKQGIMLHVMPRQGREDSGLLGMSFLADFEHTLDVKSQVIKWL